MYEEKMVRLRQEEKEMYEGKMVRLRQEEEGKVAAEKTTGLYSNIGYISVSRTGRIHLALDDIELIVGLLIERLETHDILKDN